MLEIYGTVGPKCADEKILEEMFREGMSGVRLNLSHISLKEAKPQIKMLESAAQRCKKSFELLIDMQGPELRIGKFEDKLISEGEFVRLGEGGIPVPEITLSCMLPGQQILLDDGKILLEVAENCEKYALAKALRGGTLKSKKSIALPGAEIYPPALTQSDRENLSLAAELGVSAVMQPFVRNAEDLKELRKELALHGGEKIRIFAKIENLDGVKELDNIMDEADQIVIARGDLGNAMPLYELPGCQKYIAARCNERHKPFMVVTQMLTSMEHSPVPTRAEVSDIFNAVLDGASSVMVTGETAVGDYPAEVIRYLKKTSEAAEKYLEKQYS